MNNIIDRLIDSYYKAVAAGNTKKADRIYRKLWNFGIVLAVN